MTKKKFIRKIIEAVSGGSTGWKSSSEREKEKESFEKVRDILNSTENRAQLETSVKVINNYIERYNVRNDSPEYKYLEKMLKVKKLQLGIGSKLKKMRSDENEDPSERLTLKKIIREEIKDFGWIKDVSPKEKGKIDVGDVYMVNPLNQDLRYGQRQDLSMILKIVHYSHKWDEYTYEILESNEPMEPKGYEDYIDNSWAQKLVYDGYWVFQYNETDEKIEEEPLEEEGSMWDNDENWGTDKSYWDKDPNWGEGGSYDGGGDSGGDEGSDF